MHIVVLDGHTLNPGDLNWSALQALGTCEIHPRSAPEQIAARAGQAEVLITNKVVLDRPLIALLPKLRYISVLGTGYNCVDIKAARERGIPVSNVPAYSTHSVAQRTFALLLELANQVGAHSEHVRAGGWSKAPDFTYWLSPQLELAGLTLGVIGYGRIGQAVGTIAAALGMKTIIHTRTPQSAFRRVDLETVFRNSDVLSLHCPLTADTQQLVNGPRLLWMKQSAFLINTSRGGLVDEPALAAALNEGRIAGAGLDVLSQEPPPPSHPLLTARNCIITPHQAWATVAARRRLLEVTVENIRAFVTGRPQNVVN